MSTISKRWTKITAPQAVPEENARLRECLKSCLGWTHRAMELEVSGSMREAQKRDADAAEKLLKGEAQLRAKKDQP